MDEDAKLIADAANNLINNTPVYKDALQPAAKELGKTLETTMKAVNMAISPIKALVWGYEQIEEFISIKVSEKLKDVPPENIITPDLHIFGPLIEGLRYTGEKPELREMFANLLSKSMNKDFASKAHPSFIEIIKSITSDEAKIINMFKQNDQHSIISLYVNPSLGEKRFQLIKNESIIGELAECEDLSMTSSYLGNLMRLGILEIDKNTIVHNEFEYNEIMMTKKLKKLIKKIGSNTCQAKEYTIELTPYGETFRKVCVEDDE